MVRIYQTTSAIINPFIGQRFDSQDSKPLNVCVPQILPFSDLIWLGQIYIYTTAGRMEEVQEIHVGLKITFAGSVIKPYMYFMRVRTYWETKAETYTGCPKKTQR